MRISDWSSDVCSSDLGHAAEDFGVRVVAEFELPCNEEQLLVGVGAALVVVQVLHGAQRLHVVLAVAVAVEAAGHEVGAVVFFQQAAGLHHDAGGARHQVVGVFDAAVVGAGAELHVRSEEHTSELQSLMRNSYAVFCLNKKKHNNTHHNQHRTSSTKQ